jgi:F-type H+-transporting ATPase subunit alpha
MTDAGHAVQEAAANIPAEVCARFDTAETLSDEDRATIVEIARNALARFQPKPESKPEAKPESKPEVRTEVKPKSKPTPKEKS